MVRYYIATSLKNAWQHGVLKRYLDTKDCFDITYDWTVHGSVLDKDAETRRDCALAEINAVACADVLVVLLPGRKGTHVELGVALAFNIPVIIVSPDEESLRCVFYSHPVVKKIILKPVDYEEDVARSILEVI